MLAWPSKGHHQISQILFPSILPTLSEQNIFPKEPMLTKFVKDINTFNRFIANQAIDLGSGNAPTFSEISSGFRDSVDGLFAPAKKRQDFPAIQYVPKTTQK